MLSFTLDTNCVIAVEERRLESASVLYLANAHCDERADVAVAAIMASERQIGDTSENFNDFTARLLRLGLGDLGHTYPLAYFDVTFWDACLWSGDDEPLERAIHEILFPNRPMDLAPESPPEQQLKWRNAKCDVLAIWSHIHAKRDVFVTSDGNFHKSTKKMPLEALGAGIIATPAEACLLIDKSGSR